MDPVDPRMAMPRGSDIMRLGPGQADPAGMPRPGEQNQREQQPEGQPRKGEAGELQQALRSPLGGLADERERDHEDVEDDGYGDEEEDGLGDLPDFAESEKQ